VKLLRKFEIYINISRTNFYISTPKCLRVINFTNMGIYKPTNGQPFDGFGEKFYMDITFIMTKLCTKFYLSSY